MLACHLLERLKHRPLRDGRSVNAMTLLSACLSLLLLFAGCTGRKDISVAGDASVCTVGEYRCVGQELQVCDEKQSLRVITTCEGACDAVGKRCAACVSGAMSCASESVKRQCASDGQSFVDEVCTAPRGYCGNGACVACTSSEHCPIPVNPCEVALCEGFACTSVNATRGSPCPGGVCSGDGVCWECVPNSAGCDGNTPTVCDANGKKRSELSCGGSTPFCKEGACTACMTDSQCPASVESCQIPKCRNDGTCGFDPAANGTSCGAGGSCSNGLCSSCVPGTKRCSGNTPVVCDESGTPKTGTPCANPTPFCSGEGDCVACTLTSQCTAPALSCREAQCSGNVCIAVPAQDGAACGGGQSGTCRSGECVECTLGERRCKPSSVTTAQFCTGTGRWVDEPVCTGAAPFCNQGACAATVCGNALVESGEQCDDGPPSLCRGCETCKKRNWLVLPAQSRGHITGVTLPAAAASACYEAWAKLENGTERIILSSAGSASGQVHFTLGCSWDATASAAYPYLFSANGAQTLQPDWVPGATKPSCADGAWHHYAVCRSVSGTTATLNLFVDGSLVRTATGAVASIYAPSGLSLGETGSANLSIDEVRVSNKIRYTSTFTPVRRHTRDVNTVLLYHLDEGTSTLFYDEGNEPKAPSASDAGVSDGGADASKDGGDGGSDAGVPLPNQGTIVGSATWQIDTGYRTEFCK